MGWYGKVARRAADGRIPFCKRKRFLWINCADVAPHESKDKLLAVVSHIGGRTDLVLCLDGLGPILRGESGANHKIILRAALKEARVQVLATMYDWDFEDLAVSGSRAARVLHARQDDRTQGQRSRSISSKQAAATLERDYKTDDRVASHRPRGHAFVRSDMLVRTKA